MGFCIAPRDNFNCSIHYINKDLLNLIELCMFKLMSQSDTPWQFIILYNLGSGYDDAEMKSSGDTEETMASQVSDSLDCI